jgi:DNA polymerase-1
LAERVAVNTVIQGSAADMIKIAMNNIHKQIIADALPIKLLLQVHDELVFECEKGSEGATETMVSNLMCNALDVDVPIAVQVAWGATWLDCK